VLRVLIACRLVGRIKPESLFYMLGLKPGESDATLEPGMRLGFDLVQISQIADSIRHFGDAFKFRLFTQGELNYADQSKAFCADRLAARFAAKEAVIKALRLSEHGINWRDIEVCKEQDGDCKIVLHGRVAELADAAGLSELLLSLSHDGDYAGAFVAAKFAVRH
jgi:holo-[acyl-carrier protein] synthase